MQLVKNNIIFFAASFGGSLFRGTCVSHESSERKRSRNSTYTHTVIGYLKTPFITEMMISVKASPAQITSYGPYCCDLISACNLSYAEHIPRGFQAYTDVVWR